MRASYFTDAGVKLTTLTRLATLTAIISLTACGGSSGTPDPEPPPPPAPAFTTKSALGESLYSDTNLSANRTQSCATCHNPEHAFIDDRLDADGLIGAVSLGDDEISLGDRNTPTAGYAKFSSEFHIGSRTRFNSQQDDYQGAIGGQFLDGRETDLKGQASGPPTNPIEMGMADKAAVIARIRENTDYIESFEHIFGSDIFNDTDTAYDAMAVSIGEFEKTDQFSPFDSKYDLFLKGEYTYDPLSKAAAGKALFFSQQFTNCATCHQLQPNSHAEETFTGYEYHNIGVPINQAARLLNGKPAEFVDNGLFENPEIDDEAQKGKYKTPTLRNVAVTEPYMHNGVFRDLKTVIQFYDHFLNDSDHQLNPETGLPWRNPEVPETVASAELAEGRKLDDQDVEALVCFLRTLTDARYENLIQEKGIDCGI